MGTGVDGIGLAYLSTDYSTCNRGYVKGYGRYRTKTGTERSS